MAFAGENNSGSSANSGLGGDGQPHRKLALEEQMAADIKQFSDDIYYSERYYDDEFEYRHVSLPEGLRKYLPNPPRLMTEDEWRSLGVRQSPGWEHYMVHEPEPHVLLFKREKNFQEKYPNGRP
ncbi:CKS-domain-containing protein [Martensiomyces pterosporus]|nr:CKS-domain-containing protein [Martensiomyces pterosporus]